MTAESRSRGLRVLDEFALEFLVYRTASAMFDDYDAGAGRLPDKAVIRDRNLLEAALATQRWHYYPTTFDRAGALLRSVVKDHPFVDGNKRIGMAAAFTFLALNGYALLASNEEMIEFAVELAATTPAMHWSEVARWIEQHAVDVDSMPEVRMDDMHRAGLVQGVAKIAARWPRIE